MHQDSATALISTPRPGSGASGLSVVVVLGGVGPTRATSLAGRVVTGLGDVRATDDVVILTGCEGGRRFAELVARLGADTPPVLVLAPYLDPADVRVALDHGVTGYLLESECPADLDFAVRDTAARLSWLGPGAASTLISRVRSARRAAAPAGGAGLTPRERQIMTMVADGHAPAEIAGRLRVSGKTVRNTLSSVYAKLQVRGMTEAIIVWLNRGA